MYGIHSTRHTGVTLTLKNSLNACTRAGAGGAAQDKLTGQCDFPVTKLPTGNGLHTSPAHQGAPKGRARPSPSGALPGEVHGYLVSYEYSRLPGQGLPFSPESKGTPSWDHLFPQLNRSFCDQGFTCSSQQALRAWGPGLVSFSEGVGRRRQALVGPLQ